jgi:hypothetical protein
MARLTRALLAGVALTLPTVLLAADPPAGTYKVLLPLQHPSQALWLLKLESKDDKWTGTATPGPDVILAKVEGVKVDKGNLSFTLNLGKGAFAFEGKVPKEKDAKIYGVISMRGEVNPAVLEPTMLPTLEPFDVAREVLTKSTDGVEVMQAAMVCLAGAGAKKVKPDEAEGWAEKAVKASEPFGPKWKQTVIVQIAEVLVNQEGFTGVALRYAEQAQKSLDEAVDNPQFKKRVLTVYADALDKAARDVDAKKVREEIDKIALVAVKKYPGRKAKSDRVVLVELFSCGQHPACIAPELAFDGLLGTYMPTDVVLLQYHLNQPRPEALTNAETEARAKFYETAKVTPAVFFNGEKTDPRAGGPAEAQMAYDQYSDILGALLKKPTKIKLTAAATRKGDKIEIKTGVSDLAETGPDVRLRVVLVEDEVKYTGANKIAKHRQVVRHFPNGAAGTAMKSKSANETYIVDLATVRKNITAFLDKTDIPAKDRPLELMKLRVVAFVQNDETGEILNAIQVDVKGE